MPGRLARLNRDSAPHLLNCLLQLARVAVDTRLGSALAWWWGVDLGKGCRFYGLPSFRRLPGSRIRIGGECQFRSAKWANLVGINRPCMISTLSKTANLEIGRGCGFSGTILGCAAHIRLGERVMCGANVTITDTDWHAIDWRDRALGRGGRAAPVIVGDDVWLGMNVMVLKGVEIGPRTVVAAGSVVTQSLPADVIAAGQPARVVRSLAAVGSR